MLIILLLLLALIMLLSWLKMKEAFADEKKDESYDYLRTDVQCSDPRREKYDYDTSIYCETCCQKFAEGEWKYDDTEHGWKPYSYWMNKWYQVETKTKTGDKRYQLICTCNAQK